MTDARPSPPEPDSPATVSTVAGISAAQRQRLDRWRRPLVTRWDRFSAMINMMIFDHGFIRSIHLNLHKVTDGVWRAAQPTPGQIRAFARRGGKSVVSLRAGGNFGSLPLELEACREAGLTFHNLIIRSRGLPSREEVRVAAVLFETVERPVMFHCKSGADRAGFASALFLMLAEGRPVSEARRQLSLKYGHIRLSKAGVLDAFFDTYERETANQPMALAEWVETAYDRDRITAEFKSTPLGTLVGDRLLRRE